MLQVEAAERAWVDGLRAGDPTAFDAVFAAYPLLDLPVEDVEQLFKARMAVEAMRAARRHLHAHQLQAFRIH